MVEFKGTRGYAQYNRIDKSITTPNKYVCFLCNNDSSNFYHTEDQLSANGELIADAFNVRHKINCDLPELLQQRNELYHALQAIVCNIENWLETGVPADPELSGMLYDAAKKAVTRVELIKEATEL